MSGSAEQQERNYKRLAWGAVCGGFAFAMVYGFTISGGHPVRAALSVIFLAAAPLALGGIAGFLFGIPKTLQNGDYQGGDKSEPKHRWQANTNLEQVSDWLTKILIGVGLTQLQTIPDRVLDQLENLAQQGVPL